MMILLLQYSLVEKWYIFWFSTHQPLQWPLFLAFFVNVIDMLLSKISHILPSSFFFDKDLLVPIFCLLFCLNKHLFPSCSCKICRRSNYFILIPQFFHKTASHHWCIQWYVQKNPNSKRSNLDMLQCNDQKFLFVWTIKKLHSWIAIFPLLGAKPPRF